MSIKSRGEHMIITNNKDDCKPTIRKSQLDVGESMKSYHYCTNSSYKSYHHHEKGHLGINDFYRHQIKDAFVHVPLGLKCVASRIFPSQG